MTDTEESRKALLELMKGNSPLNRARKVLVEAMGTIEQGRAQRDPITVFEAVRIELDAVKAIAAIMAEVEGVTT